jgi:hypothetical protein
MTREVATPISRVVSPRDLPVGAVAPLQSK